MNVGCRLLRVPDDAQGIELPLAVLYPTQAPEQAVRFGAYAVDLAPDSPVAEPLLGLVMLSHRNTIHFLFASMLTGACFFSYWLRVRDEMTASRMVGLGALAGLCALMRWQDVVFVVIPAIEALLWRAPLRTRAMACSEVPVATESCAACSRVARWVF